MSMVSMKRKAGLKKRGSKKPTASRIAHSLNTLQKLEVKKLIKAPEETKYIRGFVQTPDATSTLEGWTGFTQAITGVAEVYGVIPPLAQGVTSDGRVGNVIQPLRHKVNLALSLPNDNSAYDITAHVYMLRSKEVKSADNYSAVPITTMLDLGNGSDGPFDGKQQTSFCPVNREQFTVLHHKQVRLVKVQGYPFSATNQQTSPNPQHFHKLSMTFKSPAKYLYQNNVSGFPTNDFPFLVIGWVNNTVGSETVTGGSYLNVLGSSEMWYKDA